MNIKIKGPNGQTIETTAKQWSTIEETIQPVKNQFQYPPLLAKVGNDIEELTFKIGKSCTLEVLDIRDYAAFIAYQSSLILLYLKAVEKVLGRTDTEIDHALNEGLYSIIHKKGGVTANQIARIEKTMRKWVKEDLPIVKEETAASKAMDKLDELGMSEKKRLLARAKDLRNVRYYSIGDFVNYFYSHMLPSTGYLQLFELKPYRKDGVILRFPKPTSPDSLPEYRDDELLFKAFRETKAWQDILGIHYVSDLNEAIEKGKLTEIIQLSEGLHQKRVVEIAEEIVQKKRRIILIAGPTSSGKTSFAQRLSIQLTINGQRPMYLGTDDYFVERKDTPIGPDGEPDYENLDAVDIDLFNRQLKGLLNGEEVDIPIFDFLTGKKVFGKRITRLAEGQPIVIEGIHALNDTLTREIPLIEKYKIYISPLTQLNIDEHNRVPTTDARMLRRIVRDYQYRGYSAQETIARWPKIRAGEEKNIFPFTDDADAFFNSVLVYELAVMKKHAQPLLRQVKKSDPEHAEAHRLLRLLDFFNVGKEEDAIVNNSLLREFLGGSVFFK